METQILDGRGAVLGRRAREDGPGVVVADVEVGPQPAAEPLGDGFWSADLSPLLRVCWHLFNWHARRYYARTHATRRGAA